MTRGRGGERLATIGLGLALALGSVAPAAPAAPADPPRAPTIYHPNRAFRIPFKHHFLGHWLRFGGMYPDRKIRLFRRDAGRFSDRAVTCAKSPSDQASHQASS